VWIALRYLPWFAALNLIWETAHVRLYTLWNDADAAYIAFSVVHCTLGDVLIGGISLLLALILGREGSFERWRWRRIAVLTIVFGVSYTGFSEWMNITILRSWVYAESMPVVRLWDFQVGVSPLAQWLLVPPFALYLASGRAIRRAANPNTVE
jgi:hypothetical protein